MATEAVHIKCEDCGKCRVMPDEEWCLKCDYYSCERGVDCSDMHINEGKE